jgi:peptide/nickel transport system substrate-binding protein
VILRHTPEAAAQRLLLEKGDVDIARELTSDQIAGLAGNPDVVVNSYESGELWYMALNMKDERLANAKVREAIRYLIDYQGMASSFLKGQLIVHQSFWPSGFPDSLGDNPFSLDPAKAKQLLTEAGYPNGFDVRLDTPNSAPLSDIAQSIQQSMAAGGIKVDLVQEDSRQVTVLLKARKHQMALLHWNPDYLDPHANAAVFASNTDNSDNPPAKTLAWRTGWYIPELSAETAAAVQEKDDAKREAMYLDIQQKVQADSPLLVLFQSTKRIAMRSNIKGFVFGPTYGAIFYRLMTK